MAARPQFLGSAVLILIAACDRSATVRDPIEGIPISRQRTISRADLGFRWPLSVGVGQKLDCCSRWRVSPKTSSGMIRYYSFSCH